MSKNELVNEFSSFKTIKQKLDFWNSGKLALNYIQFEEADLETKKIFKPFIIEFKTEDFEEMNIWIIDNYFKYSSHPTKHNRLLQYKDLQEDFESRFSEVKEDAKEQFITRELKNIKASFEQKYTIITGKFEFEIVNHKFNADYEAFNDYLEFRELCPDYSSIPPSVYYTLQKENGVTLARYYNYLHQKLDEYLFGVSDDDFEELAMMADEKDDKEVNEKSNVRTQLQILHFLGVFDKIKNTGTVEQKGAFLSVLLNRNPQRARKPFSTKSILYDNDKAEAKNIRRDLEKVEKLFYAFGLKDEANEAKNAIMKINKSHFPEDL